MLNDKRFAEIGLHVLQPSGHKPELVEAEQQRDPLRHAHGSRRALAYRIPDNLDHLLLVVLEPRQQRPVRALHQTSYLQQNQFNSIRVNSSENRSSLHRNRDCKGEQTYLQVCGSAVVNRHGGVPLHAGLT
jgi:hypothetical protein